MQVENGQTKYTNNHSRSVSPVPCSVLPEPSLNNSSPRLPLPRRRSSFSTERSADTLDKPLLTQRSHPHLRRKIRRGSDITAAEESISSDSSFLTAANTESRITLANDKRNNDFHSLFRSVPDGERLIDDYGCALQKEILLQGRIYISERHICFNANIFGWITNLVIAFADIEDIEKRSTAIFIPNAILISTSTSKHFFASFLSRDQAFDQMVEVWKQLMLVQQQEKEEMLKAEHMGDGSSTSSDSSTEGDDMTADLKSIQERQSSLASLPIPKHLMTDEAARRRAISESGTRPSLREFTSVSEPQLPTTVKYEKTECECSDNHFPTVVMDKTYDTTLETMYKLLYNSNFMTTFLTDIEMSTEVCIGQWKEGADGIKYIRDSSYIKFLGSTIGPKSTKCYLKEEIHHLDINEYITQLTITQTPDVPSGGSFNVKTRTCISWAGQGKVRVLVTVLIDFTKSSWLKSTIEKASIDGQQSFYKSLDAALCKYLEEKQPKKYRASTVVGKRRKQKRHVREKSIPIKKEEPPKALLDECLSMVSSFIDSISIPSTTHMTAFCMAVMVCTNCYIASKMAGVDRQLSEMNYSGKNFAVKQRYDGDSSLWQLLGRMDPDASVTHPQWTQNVPDDQLEYSQLAKESLDRQMVELETMIKKAGESMEQVTQVVQKQRERILHPDWVR
ncbi:GRAM-domain-containing protein [Backusella circina FSU 941]|nr:GRAM-domain-containing protein [Backusella circina FSU 941]